MNSICTAIVTFNRLDLLKGAIASIKAQTQPTDIIIINNGSTDGTKEFLDKCEGIKVIHQDNCGGAGGFFTALKFITESGYKFAWVMDDDIVAQPDTLKYLYEAYKDLSKNEEIGFLCSTVLSGEGETVNVPQPSKSRNSTGYQEWNKYLYRGIVKVDMATFVSVFLSTEMVMKVGLPLREYFIWGDDSEYTMRISSKFPCYLIGKSQINHLRNGGALNLNNIDDPRRISMFSNYVRNNLCNIRKYDSSKKLRSFIISHMKQGVKFFLLQGKFNKAKAIFKGLFAGLQWNPSIEFPNPDVEDLKK